MARQPIRERFKLMNEKILKMVEEYASEALFTTAPLTDEMISSAELALGWKLPTQFVEYVRQLGYGGIGGVDILGVTLSGTMAFLEETLNYREEGLPNNLLVIENNDEFLYCLDATTGSVVMWPLTGNPEQYSESFDDFICEEFKNAIENL